ncbi:hypothetical protein JYK22_03900, partial [Nonomuraea sp. RK-328]|nr:hypothetical protein [Nonomuraea sp. RK-328]
MIGCGRPIPGRHEAHSALTWTDEQRLVLEQVARSCIEPLRRIQRIRYALAAADGTSNAPTRAALLGMPVLCTFWCSGLVAGLLAGRGRWCGGDWGVSAGQSICAGLSVGFSWRVVDFSGRSSAAHGDLGCALAGRRSSDANS